MTAVVDARDVTFAFGDRPVVQDVSLAIEEGEFLGLVGPNGSGKTTLLELLIGLRRPDEGSVQLFGEPAHRRETGERVGYVPQNVSNAAGEMPVTVREAVRMGRYPGKPFGLFDDADRAAVDAALQRVG
ncbi:MAG: ATP-binding cassette domain-containing protein, partial [Halolamina sp.]